MAGALDGGGHKNVVQNRKEERLGMHYSVPFEFSTRSFTSPVESIPYAALGCAKERFHRR